jgi:hypothetical protein
MELYFGVIPLILLIYLGYRKGLLELSVAYIIESHVENISNN